MKRAESILGIRGESVTTYQQEKPIQVNKKIGHPTDTPYQHVDTTLTVPITQKEDKQSVKY